MRSEDAEYKGYIEQQARELGLIKDEYLETKPFMFDLEEALKSGIYVCGTTGSGKSDIGMYAASLLMKHDVIVVVVDGSQDWLNRSDVSYYQTLETSFIDKIPEHSIIYDISQLTIPEQQSLVESFCKRLMLYQATIPEKERRQYFLIFEEAHTDFPEGCMRAKRFQNTVKMMTQGRNFKVRFMAITQFSSLIDKQAMRYMKQRYFGFTDEPNDTEYVANFIGKKYIEQVKRLQAGEFIYYHAGMIKKIYVEPFQSSIPKRLIRITEPKPIEPIKPKPQTSDLKAVCQFAMLCLWLVMLWIALSQRGF